MRQAIAQLAAQLLADNAELTFSAARRKAQQRLGCEHSRDVPHFEEIETALIEHQRLFGGDTHAQHLLELRRHALSAMRFLAPYQPYLVGRVLSGTACKHSKVCLHVFADTAEEVMRHLIDHGVPYRLGERRYRQNGTAYPLLGFVAGETPIELVVFPLAKRYQAPLSEINGQPIPRADVADLEVLLNNSPCTPPLPAG